MSDDILITTDPDGGTAVLTTNSPASHYGCPVLRIEAEDVDGDFGPADLIDFGAVGQGIIPAATIVHAWATAPQRSDEERQAARRFLRQWPDGPQLDEGGDL